MFYLFVYSRAKKTRSYTERVRLEKTGKSKKNYRLNVQQVLLLLKKSVL